MNLDYPNPIPSCCTRSPTPGQSIHRRAVLQSVTRGLAGIALADLLAGDSLLADGPAPNPTALSHGHPIVSHGIVNPLHVAPRAKRVIFLFMHGGPSHLDTFDYKPELVNRHGQPLPFEKPRIQFAKTGNLLRSPWEFQQYGESGTWVSSLFPNVAKHVDDLTFIHSLYGSNEAHGGALLKIHTGSDTFVRPSMGAWISYGLGTENSDLPSFITINPTLGHGGVRNFGSAFLPPIHQATRIGSSKISNLSPTASSTIQREQLDLMRDLDAISLGNEQGQRLADVIARQQSFELAFRMQAEAGTLLDINNETQETLALYGVDQGPTDSFARQCIVARRLSESGVRFVQVSHAYWDQHESLKIKHTELAQQVDLPIAGLLTDLKRRGLLEDTLVMWGGEFGRTPTAQGDDGRDHNPHAFTWWFAGGGMKKGFHYGSSDEFGFYARDDKVHVHDLHATLLHMLGIDHERLTYRYGGRDFRLTDVEGRVVDEIFAS